MRGGRWGPTRGEDAKNVAVIVASGALGVALTGFLLAYPVVERTVTVQRADQTTVHITDFEGAGSSAADLLYGTVRTQDGATHTGFLRWDRNEAAWTDLLEATKPGPRNVTTGVRFGHLRVLMPTGATSADVVLRSGRQLRLLADATDLGVNFRGLAVHDATTGDAVELAWLDIERVEFQPAPEDAPEALGRRLHGTLTTTSGRSFTGHVAWDVEESMTTDVLDGRDAAGVDHDIAFGSIAAIRPLGPRGARVVLRSGEAVELSGSEDVDRRNGGVTVSDPALGQVRVDWAELAEVRFHGARGVAAYDDFEVGAPLGARPTLRGVVETTSGATVVGTLRWDRDEAAAWEILDGSSDGVDFQIEFAHIVRVIRDGDGALVELRDGRSVRLGGSNDVDHSNLGIVVRSGRTEFTVAWDAVRAVTLSDDG